jgi:hypothetical protein
MIKIYRYFLNRFILRSRSRRRKKKSIVPHFSCSLTLKHHQSKRNCSISDLPSDVPCHINSFLCTISRDLRNSNNLFHWALHDNTVERNSHGGFDISLPYMWQYNVNYTHSVVLHNTTWRNNRNFGIVIDGHYAQCNISGNVFDDNRCKGEWKSSRLKS